MKKVIALGLLLVAINGLTGCLSQQEIAQRNAESSAISERLNASYAFRTVDCKNKMACDKAFNLTKIYIQEHSDMKVQFADDTIISTYGPIEYGYLGFAATKTPEAGETAKIKLSISCKGFESFNFTACAKRMAPIYENYKGYIEGKLK